MHEISSSLRNGPEEPTVVQAIQRGNAQIIQELQAIVRQGGGTGAGGPPSRGTAAESGDPHFDRFNAVFLNIETTLEKIERILNSTAGHGGGGPEGNFFTREVAISTFQSVEKLFMSEQERIRRGLDTTSLFGEFKKLLDQEAVGSVKSLTSNLLNLGVNTANLGASFSRLNQHVRDQVAGVRESGVFGSNVLGPQEFFFEGLTRTFQGVLTDTDSFRTALHLVHDSLQNDMISPLATTGRSVSELAGDLHSAREDMRQRFGFDTRAWMGTQDANKALSALVEMQSRFGVQSGINSIRTEQMAARDGNFLKMIATATGETVAKLESQLAAQRQQQDILVGLGRLSEKELANFTANQVGLEKLFGPNGKAFAEQLAGLLRYGRNEGEIVTNPALPSEYRTIAAVEPEMWRQMMSSLNLLRNQQMAPDQLAKLVSGFGSRAAGGQFQNLSPAAQLAVFPGQADMLARLVTLGNMGAARPSADASQRATQQDNGAYSLLQRLTEIWQEQIKPFMAIEVSLGLHLAALALNTRALWAVAATMTIRGGNEGGFMASAGGFLRGVSRAAPLIGGAVAGATEYAETGSVGRAAGVGLGTGGGAWAGAALGAALTGPASPLGAIVGAILGGVVGNLVSSKVADAVGPRQAGPGAPEVAAEPIMANDNATNVMSQILSANAEQNSWLSQIKSELSRQTGYLTGVQSPAGAPAVGMGLAASVPSQAGSLGRPDAGTAYSY